MKLNSLIIIFTTLVTSLCYAQEFPDFPNNPVLDEADILSESQEHQLNARVKEFEKTTTMQIRLVTVKDVSPYETASLYTEDLYHYWKLGDKDKHNGLLMVIAQKIGKNSQDMKDYCRIMTGWGIVTIIPDHIVIDDIKHKYMMTKLPSQPYLAFDNSLDRIFQDVNTWKIQHPEDNTVKSEDDHTKAGIGESKAESASNSWLANNWGWLLLGGGGGIIFLMIGLAGGFSSSNSSYYSSSYNNTTSSSKTKKKDSSSSGCGSAGCGSSGCGGGGCGGGGCGGGGCGG